MALIGAVARRRTKPGSADREIIFVTHSLGGLVTEAALSLAEKSLEPHFRRVEQSCVGVIFLGVPHFGSEVANWGTFGARMLNLVLHMNAKIVEVLKPDPEMLSLIKGLPRLAAKQAIRKQAIRKQAASCFWIS